MVDGCYGEEDFSRPDLRVDQDQILQALVLGHSVNHGMQVMQNLLGLHLSDTASRIASLCLL